MRKNKKGNGVFFSWEEAWKKWDDEIVKISQAFQRQNVNPKEPMSDETWIKLMKMKESYPWLLKDFNDAQPETMEEQKKERWCLAMESLKEEKESTNFPHQWDKMTQRKKEAAFEKVQEAQRIWNKACDEFLFLAGKNGVYGNLKAEIIWNQACQKRMWQIAKIRGSLRLASQRKDKDWVMAALRAIQWKNKGMGINQRKEPSKNSMKGEESHDVTMKYKRQENQSERSHNDGLIISALLIMELVMESLNQKPLDWADDLFEWIKDCAPSYGPYVLESAVIKACEELNSDIKHWILDKGKEIQYSWLAWDGEAMGELQYALKSERHENQNEAKAWMDRLFEDPRLKPPIQNKEWDECIKKYPWLENKIHSARTRLDSNVLKEALGLENHGLDSHKDSKSSKVLRM